MTTLIFFVPSHFALLDDYFIVGSLLLMSYEVPFEHIYAHVHPSEIHHRRKQFMLIPTIVPLVAMLQIYCRLDV